jgi:hypothetical protein
MLESFQRIEPNTAAPCAPPWIVERARQSLRLWLSTGLADAHAHPIDERILLPRYLLQLYRMPLAGLTDTRKWHQAFGESVRTITRGPFSASASSDGGCLLSSSLAEVSSEDAHEIQEHHHYLGTCRSGYHLGLFHAERPFALVTLSYCDVSALQEHLPAGLEKNDVLILSRIVVSRAAPANTASFLIGRMFAWLRQHRPDVKLLLTYLDPNLGFSGSLYSATNWFQFATEYKSPYLYLDARFTTHRSLCQRYGTLQWDSLRAILGDRLSRSSFAPLQPLKVFGYFLDKRLMRELMR